MDQYPHSSEPSSAACEGVRFLLAERFYLGWMRELDPGVPQGKKLPPPGCSRFPTAPPQYIPKST